MQRRKDNESRFFADLTRLLMERKHLSHEQVDAEIEDRFREFVRTPAGSGRRTLRITTTWTLPEGANSWPIYETRYRVDPPARAAATARPPRRKAATGQNGGATTCAIIRFPGPAIAEPPAPSDARLPSQGAVATFSDCSF